MLLNLPVSVWLYMALLLCSQMHVLFQFFFIAKETLCIYICIFNLNKGNAAIVLRSRLVVRVLKENWEKKARMDEKGIILTNGDVESSRKAMQYQVTPAPYTATSVCLHI